MQTIGIVLNVDTAKSEEFERGFQAEEAPIWADLHGRGLLVIATLTRLADPSWSHRTARREPTHPGRLRARTAVTAPTP